MSEDLKKLYRSRKDRMIGGVCGGLGEYLSIDPTVIRLIFAISVLWGGFGLFVYLVMLLVIPEKPLEASETPTDIIEEEESEETA